MKVVHFLRLKKQEFRVDPLFLASLVRKFVVGALLASVLVSVSACQTTSSGQTTNSGKKPMSGRQNDQNQDMNSGQHILLRAGQDAETEHKYDVAANAYGRLFEQRSNDPDVLANFIRTMRYSDRAPEIVRYVETKTQHLMDDVNVKFEYGKALLAAGKKSKALRVLQEVSLRRVANWKVDSAIGIAYDALGQFPNAILSYRKALEISPNNVVVMNNMAMSQAMAGALNEAIATLEEAANINRSNVHVRQNLALLYAVKGDINKARALASMDLSKIDTENNLSFYRRFEGKAYE